MTREQILQRIPICAYPEFAGRIAFVEDYGEQTINASHGVDVWLNNPPHGSQRTSGMKARNGV